MNCGYTKTGALDILSDEVTRSGARDCCYFFGEYMKAFRVDYIRGVLRIH